MGEIAALDPADFDAVARLVRQGFGHPREQADRLLALFGPGTLRGLRPAGGGLSAVAAVWSMEQWFGGRPVPAQAVAMVAVDPAERGRGLGSALMRGILDEARQAGAAVSVLHPATLPFYTRLGYGRGGLAVDWSAPLAVMPGEPAADAAVLPLVSRDATALAAIRRTMLEAENGLPERTEAMWSLALASAEGEAADVFLLSGPHGPEGYVSLAPPAGRQLTVTDWCLPTRRSLLSAARLFAGFRAQADTVRWRGGPDDALTLLTAESGVRVAGREEWLLRILDLRRALESRGYPPGLSASLTLDVTDPLVAANTGLFVLRIDQGCGIVTQVWEEPEEVLKVGVPALASLYTGRASAAALQRAGLLRASPSMVAQAGRIFAGPSPWMPDRF